jgi:hypothetical protein
MAESLGTSAPVDPDLDRYNLAELGEDCPQVGLGRVVR